MNTHEWAPIKWDQGSLFVLDQRKLPHQEIYFEIKTIEDCYFSINSMLVRGAPLIGFTAIFGIAVWLKNNDSKTIKDLITACDYLKTARPTAVNLEFEINNCLTLSEKYYSDTGSLKELSPVIINRGEDLILSLDNDNKKMGEYASLELEEIYGDKRYKLMTICNTGRLACGTMGTALGVITHLNLQKKIHQVFASETRPYMQGSRLTALELSKSEIDYRVVVEGASSFILANKNIDAIFVGADRVANNGDTANKIGTSSLAIIANYYKIPFYVVAPISSFDLSIDTGSDIAVEIRNELEVIKYNDKFISPSDARAFNPSFDITPSKLITGIVCEKGIIKPSLNKNITDYLNEKS